MRLRLVLLLAAMMLTELAALTVSNIRVSQDKELGYYTITFDLSGKADELYSIKTVPYKNGTDFLNSRSFSGQGISEPCASGTSLSIYWNPAIEGLDKDNWQFRLTAIAFPNNMVFVEGGTFIMGIDNGERDEQPVHQVTLSSFYIGKYEVTQKEWQEVMVSNPAQWNGDKLPVERVSWYEAVDYCNKRSIKEGLKPCYSGSGSNITCDWSANGYRLPTEAEWEYAARGGNKCQGYTNSGSNDLGSVAWYDGNSGSRTHEVGTKLPNELGIYDMSGNVCEWCWDWYDSYSSESQNNPKEANTGSYRVLRGGSWYNFDFFCRAVSRSSNRPGFRFNYLGLRVLRAR